MPAETETLIPSTHCSIREGKRLVGWCEHTGVEVTETVYEVFLHSDDYKPTRIATYATFDQAIRRADSFRRQFGA